MVLCKVPRKKSLWGGDIGAEREDMSESLDRGPASAKPPRLGWEQEDSRGLGEVVQAAQSLGPWRGLGI